MRAFAVLAVIGMAGCTRQSRRATKPAPPPAQPAPSQTRAAATCGHKCARAFAAQLTRLHQAGHRLSAVEVTQTRTRWSLSFTMAKGGQASAVRLHFEPGGKAVLAHTSSPVVPDPRARVYEDEAELLRLFEHGWPKSLVERESIYALTLVDTSGKEVTVPIDPGDYYVVESVSEGAAAPAAVVGLLTKLLGKYDLTFIAASPGKRGERSAVTFAWSGGKDDQLVYVDCDAAGAPIRVELRWTNNIQPSRVLPPGQQARLRTWLRGHRKVTRIVWMGERLARANGHRLELHGAKGAAFVFDVQSLQ